MKMNVLKILTFYVNLFLLALHIGCSSSSKRLKENQSSHHQRQKIEPILKHEFNDFYDVKTNSSSLFLNNETIHLLESTEMKPSLVKDLKKHDELFNLSYLCKRNQIESALMFSRKIYSRYKNIPSYWNTIASCYLKTQNYRKALLYINYALEKKSDYLPALNNLGVMYSLMGYDQKALLVWKKGIQLYPFSKTLRLNLAGMYFKHGLFSLAEPLLYSLYKEDFRTPELLVSLGICYSIKNESEKSLFYFNKISKQDLKNENIGLRLAYGHLLLGDKTKAKKIFQRYKNSQLKSRKKEYQIIKDLLSNDSTKVRL